MADLLAPGIRAPGGPLRAIGAGLGEPTGRRAFTTDRCRVAKHRQAPEIRLAVTAPPRAGRPARVVLVLAVVATLAAGGGRGTRPARRPQPGRSSRPRPRRRRPAQGSGARPAAAPAPSGPLAGRRPSTRGRP